jgi:hypothetical protein
MVIARADVVAIVLPRVETRQEMGSTMASSNATEGSPSMRSMIPAHNTRLVYQAIENSLMNRGCRDGLGDAM